MKPKITLKYLTSLYNKEIDKKLDKYLKYHNTLPIEEQIKTMKDYGQCLLERSNRDIERSNISIYINYFLAVIFLILTIIFYILWITGYLSKWGLQMREQ